MRKFISEKLRRIFAEEPVAKQSAFLIKQPAV
jgi:hypothetical protein